jgi:hypothetical protein
MYRLQWYDKGDKVWKEASYEAFESEKAAREFFDGYYIFGLNAWRIVDAHETVVYDSDSAKPAED